MQDLIHKMPACIERGRVIGAEPLDRDFRHQLTRPSFDEAKECAGETDVIIYNAAYLDEIAQRRNRQVAFMGSTSASDPQLKFVVEEIDREFMVLPRIIPDVTGRLPESDSKTFVKARSHL